MRAGSRVFTQPPRIINRLLSSLVTFLDIWAPVAFLRLTICECVCEEDS